MNLASPTGAVYDDTLEDMGGVCLFDITKPKFANAFPFFKEFDKHHWSEIGMRVKNYTNKDAYVRFVDPANDRFGSIAKLALPSYHSYYWGSSPPSTTQLKEMTSWNGRRSWNGCLKWDKRSNQPAVWIPDDHVEFLPDYEGPTVWQFDRSRSKRTELVVANDRLGRQIQIGDFCCYILYQFDGRGMAGQYFGNVTKVDIDGTVWCKNISLSSTDKMAEKPVKDSKLITILTDDLMRQLMLCKLSSG